MESEQYEILPHEELEALRKEVEYLKRNPLGDTKQAEDLKSSINELSESIHALIKLFTDVNADMMEDFKKMTVEHHFANLSKQNETIAQGLVSVAEMIKKYHKEDQEQKAQQPQTTAPAPPPGFGPTSGLAQGSTQQYNQNQAPLAGSPQMNQPPPFTPQQTTNDQLNFSRDQLPGQDIANQIANEGYRGPPPQAPQPEESNKKKGLLRFK